jgi:hypothetical protein
MKNALALFAASIALLLGSGLTAPAEAQYVVDLTQVPDTSQPLGFDLVATGTGTIDLAGISFRLTGINVAQLNRSSFVIGPPATLPLITTPSSRGLFQFFRQPLGANTFPAAAAAT